ncbi:MAG: rare lipoprotein [Actinomycetota bacterium]|nr:rare lipoprotein [Actinomycetota bacterium]
MRAVATAIAGVAMLAGCSHKIPVTVGPPPPTVAGPHPEEVGGKAPNPGQGVSEPSASSGTMELPPASSRADVPPVSTGEASRTPAPAAASTTTVSWYGAESGFTTADGETFDPSALTFAHRSMPFGAVVEFCAGGACVVAQCNDRGPWVAGRDFDLSRGAFARLAPLSAGVLEVSWTRVA